MRRAYILLATVAVMAASVAPIARASVRDAGNAARVSTSVSADTVTVGQRFDVQYGLTFADTLMFVTPVKIDPGLCRVIDTAWDVTPGNAARGKVTFIAVNLDSVLVPPQSFDFVSPAGDTLRAWSEPVELGMRYLSAGSEDLRPLKEQWTMPPNWLLWISLVVAGLALAGAIVWWIRRRRARRGMDAVPEIRIPADITALAELDRVERLGLVARGEYKTFYTLVVDALRRYVEARFGVEALDRTTHELLDDLERSGVQVVGLAALLDEADLVKFAKYKPDAETANAALSSARDVVISTTRRAASGPPGQDASGQVAG